MPSMKILDSWKDTIDEAGAKWMEGVVDTVNRNLPQCCDEPLRGSVGHKGASLFSLEAHGERNGGLDAVAVDIVVGIKDGLPWFKIEAFVGNHKDAGKWKMRADSATALADSLVEKCQGMLERLVEAADADRA